MAICICDINYCGMQQGYQLSCEFTRAYRKHIIEQAYQNSHQHVYIMPRIQHLHSEHSSEDIPLVYDLYSQNRSRAVHTRIIPVHQLAKLHTNHSTPSFNLLSHCKPQNSCELNSAKITRTLSKNYPRMNKAQSSLLLCCEKQEELDRYETREISLEHERTIPYSRIKTAKISE